MGKKLRSWPTHMVGKTVALAGEDLIFRSIKAVDYEEVFRILHHDQKRLETRNADAAAPIHVAFLFLHHDLGQAMIEAYPWCALFEYGPGPYEGENCLHIVISQRKYGPFEWLLTHHPELLNAETIGEFFAPTGIAYFGGYPLLFAVSTNQTAMVQCIAQLNAGNTSVMNRIHVADRFGNNALHMAVIHDLPEMAQFIWELEKADPMQPPLAERANDEGLTPLALAAAMGRVAMFRLLLTCGIREAWVYGPMKGNMVPLRGLDQPYLLGRDRLSHCRLAMACFCAPGEDRVTRCLPSEVPDNVRKGRLELALLPEIRAILDKKWKHFGRRLFLRRFIPILIVMALWTAAIIIPNSYVEDSTNLSSYPISNGLIIACESVVLAYVVWSTLREIIALFHLRKEYFRADTGVVATIYWLKSFFCLFVLVDVGLRAGLQYNAQLVFTALASLTGWMLVLANLVALRTTGAFVLVVQSMIVNDVRRFFLVWILVVMAFTCALYLTRPTNVGDTEPLIFWRTFRDTIVLGTVGEFVFLNLLDGPAPWLLNLLIVLYLFFQILILLSIIIATLSNTYRNIIKDAEARFYIERHTLMMYLESVYSVEGMYHQRCKYASKLPDDNTDYDADLYLPVVLTNTHWKGNVSMAQQPLIEAREREDILSEEQIGWSRILHRMADKGLHLPRSPHGPYSTPMYSEYPPNQTLYY